ncbi:hypothetical protein U1Q18_027995 [Sarracenia purpurea var. burkii]
MISSSAIDDFFGRVELAEVGTGPSSSRPPSCETHIFCEWFSKSLRGGPPKDSTLAEGLSFFTLLFISDENAGPDFPKPLGGSISSNIPPLTDELLTFELAELPSLLISSSGSVNSPVDEATGAGVDSKRRGFLSCQESIWLN